MRVQASQVAVIVLKDGEELRTFHFYKNATFDSGIEVTEDEYQSHKTPLPRQVRGTCKLSFDYDPQDSTWLDLFETLARRADAVEEDMAISYDCSFIVNHTGGDFARILMPNVEINPDAINTGARTELVNSKMEFVGSEFQRI